MATLARCGAGTPAVRRLLGAATASISSGRSAAAADSSAVVPSAAHSSSCGSAAGHFETTTACLPLTSRMPITRWTTAIPAPLPVPLASALTPPAAATASPIVRTFASGSRRFEDDAGRHPEPTQAELFAMEESRRLLGGGDDYNDDDDGGPLPTKEDLSSMTNDELADMSTIPGWDLVHSPPRKFPRGALVGTVVSTKMDKTVNVSVDRYRMIPKYRKRRKYSKKFMAHDEEEVCAMGDMVMIVPCQRISKRKHFMVREIIRATGVL